MLRLPRIHRGGLLVLAALAPLALSSFASAAARVNGLTINVTYTATSLQAKLSNGTVLASGAVVPPGAYSVVVYDSDFTNPQFTLSGPGASVSSDLGAGSTGIQSPTILGPFVLQASSSYQISDANLPGAASISFTTSATGSSASTDDQTTTASRTASAPAAGATSTLALFVGTSGKPLLTLAGKPVKTLEAGTYSMIVSDSSARAGLVLGHGKARPSTLSGKAATGTTDRRLKLAAGRWYYESSAKGPRSYFTVR